MPGGSLTLTHFLSIWSGRLVRNWFLVFGPKPAARELFQTVPDRIGLGFEILFILIPNMMKIGKICLKPTFCGFLAIEDLSCNRRTVLRLVQ